MKYYILDPEVAGGLGSRTQMDSSVHPPGVTLLHYELEAWAGEDLVQTFPCYLVTKRMQAKLTSSRLSGFSFASADVSGSDTFKELQPGEPLPELVWFKIHGVSGKDDFGLTADARLVVSERALKVIQTGQLKYCEVREFKV